MFNNGGYCNPEIDKLTDAMAVETDQAKRAQIIRQANQLLKDDVGYIPLHQQTVVWAMKQNVEVAQFADNYFPLRFVNMK